MKTVKKKKPQLISEAFEKELLEIIDLRLQTSQELLSQEEIKDIIKSLIPDLDKLISDKIKNHMNLLGESLINLSKKE